MPRRRMRPNEVRMKPPYNTRAPQEISPEEAGRMFEESSQAPPPVAPVSRRSREPAPILQLTVGDGFRFGLGLIIAQLVFAVVVLLIWIAGVGALVAAVAAGR